MFKAYGYRVRDRLGTPFSGIIEAQNKEAVVSRLQNQGYYIIKVYPVLFQRNKLFRKQGVKKKDLAAFCRQLAAMISAGVPILACLTVLENHVKNKRLSGITGNLIRFLEQGYPFSEALQQYPNVFPKIFVGMIKAGEQSGDLDHTLEQVALHFEKEYDLEERIKLAISYPLIVAIVSLIAVLIIITFVFPPLVQMLDQQNATLPLATRVLLGINNFMAKYWYLVLIIIVLFYLTIVGMYRMTRGRILIDKTLLRLPLCGNFIKTISITRFCRTLSLLIRSGIPIIQAMDTAKGTVPNTVMAMAIEETGNNISRGLEVAEGLIQSQIFPLMVTQMVKVGEKTGELDKSLDQVASFYEKELHYALSRIISLAEPVLIIIVGGIIGFIVSSVYLPMVKVIETVY